MEWLDPRLQAIAGQYTDTFDWTLFGQIRPVPDEWTGLKFLDSQKWGSGYIEETEFKFSKYWLRRTTGGELSMIEQGRSSL